MRYKHLYNALISNGYYERWVRVWAYNKEDVYHVCVKRYPFEIVELIEYVK